jgi:hypothetical protein
MLAAPPVPAHPHLGRGLYRSRSPPAGSYLPIDLPFLARRLAAASVDA